MRRCGQRTRLKNCRTQACCVTTTRSFHCIRSHRRTTRTKEPSEESSQQSSLDTTSSSKVPKTNNPRKFGMWKKCRRIWKQQIVLARNRSKLGEKSQEHTNLSREGTSHYITNSWSWQHTHRISSEDCVACVNKAQAMNNKASSKSRAVTAHRATQAEVTRGT